MPYTAKKPKNFDKLTRRQKRAWRKKHWKPTKRRTTKRRRSSRAWSGIRSVNQSMGLYGVNPRRRKARKSRRRTARR
jgi:hypothetical protein